MTSRTLTPGEIAERIRMTSAYVRSLCESGELPARKCGKFWRVDEADFVAWWAKGKTSSTSPTVLQIAGRR